MGNGAGIIPFRFQNEKGILPPENIIRDKTHGQTPFVTGNEEGEEAGRGRGGE